MTPTGGALKTVSDKPIKTEVGITKKWIGPEAGPVTVHLLADGTETGKTITLDANGSWTGSFDSLRKYASDGHEIKYTVSEDAVEGYASAITGNATSGFTVTNTSTEKISVSGTKTWDDGNDQDGMRPTSITVNPMRDGTKIDAVDVSPGSDGNWEYSFADLSRYDPSDGHEYSYTVTENAVAGYTTTINGTSISNTHEPETISIPVAKRWIGEEGGPITVHLLADGTDTGKTLMLDKDGNWTGSFTELAKYSAGREISYTISKDAADGYTSQITGDATSGFTVTNTLVPKDTNPKTPKETKVTKVTRVSTGILPKTGARRATSPP